MNQRQITSVEVAFESLLHLLPAERVKALVQDGQWDFIALSSEQAKEGLETEGFTVFYPGETEQAIEKIIEAEYKEGNCIEVVDAFCKCLPAELIKEAIGKLLERLPSV